MLKTARVWGMYLVLVFCAVSVSGCVPLIAGAAVGASGYAWVKGILSKEMEVPATKLYSATIKGMKKLDLPIQTDKHDRLSAKVTSEFADGKNVTIEIRALTEVSSKIDIRVGLFGDKVKSEMILNAIQGYL